jgi:hypothetical protein
VTELPRLYNTSTSLYDLWFTTFWKATDRYRERPQMNWIRLMALLGHEKSLERMLQMRNDYDIDECDNEGHTALMWACEFVNENVVRMLLDKGPT